MPVQNRTMGSGEAIMQEKLDGLTKRIIALCQSLNYLAEDEFRAAEDEIALLEAEFDELEMKLDKVA